MKDKEKNNKQKKDTGKKITKMYLNNLLVL